jgi:CSLREA domain-containing protein
MSALKRTGWSVSALAVVAALVTGGGAASAAVHPVTSSSGIVAPHVVLGREFAVTPGQLATPARLARPTHAGALGVARLHAVRAAEARMKARDRVAPRFDSSRAAVTTFTVNTTVDSPLATSGGKTCVDAQVPAKCSLRAAVEAANNLAKPVQVTLPSGTYTLTTGTALLVTDPAGLSITGTVAAHTAIVADGSGVIDEWAPTSNQAKPLLFLTHVRVSGSTDAYGAIYIGDESNTGGEAVFTRDVFTDNTASGAGAAIDDYDESSVYVTDCTLSDNTSPDGGAIYGYYSYLNLVGDKITHNSSIVGAGGSGGAIWTEYGVVTITGGTLSDNSAGDLTHEGHGGAIYDLYSDYTLTGVTVTGDTAGDGGEGGAIYADEDQIDVTGGSLSNDSTTGVNGYGGGIYVEYGTILGLHDVTIANDHTDGTATVGHGGGAIYDYGDYVDDNITIDDHTSITGATNSAIYLDADYGRVGLDLSQVTMTKDTDASTNGSLADSSSDPTACGGAICAYNYEYGSTDVVMTRDAIIGDSSNGSFGAGAVVADGGEYGYISLRLDHDLFRGNVGHGDVTGGAVQLASYYYDTGSLEATGSTFIHNKSAAGGAGGALELISYDPDSYYNPLSLHLTKDVFTGNTVGLAAHDAVGVGGAMFIDSYASLIDHDSTFEGNRAFGAGAEGGAIYNNSYYSAHFYGTVFRGNSAPSAGTGGGAYFTNDESGDVYQGVTMSGNSAQYGGAIYAAESAYDQAIVDSTFANNIARAEGTQGPGEGGAIFDYVSTLVSTNSTFSGNVAQSVGSQLGLGGAIAAIGAGPASFFYSTISENTAKGGAGIYEDGTGGTLLGTILSGNVGRNCSVAAPDHLLSSLGENVLTSSACVSALRSTDTVTGHPGVYPLAFNGGPTKTMALKSFSPAIDRAGYDCPATDERGVARPAAACDAGAYQLTAVVIDPTRWINRV